MARRAPAAARCSADRLLTQPPSLRHPRRGNRDRFKAKQDPDNGKYGPGRAGAKKAAAGDDVGDEEAGAAAGGDEEASQPPRPSQVPGLKSASAEDAPSALGAGDATEEGAHDEAGAGPAVPVSKVEAFFDFSGNGVEDKLVPFSTVALYGLKAKTRYVRPRRRAVRPASWRDDSVFRSQNGRRLTSLFRIPLRTPLRKPDLTLETAPGPHPARGRHRGRTAADPLPTPFPPSLLAPPVPSSCTSGCESSMASRSFTPTSLRHPWQLHTRGAAWRKFSSSLRSTRRRQSRSSTGVRSTMRRSRRGGESSALPSPTPSALARAASSSATSTSAPWRRTCCGTSAGSARSGKPTSPRWRCRCPRRTAGRRRSASRGASPLSSSCTRRTRWMRWRTVNPWRSAVERWPWTLRWQRPSSRGRARSKTVRAAAARRS